MNCRICGRHERDPWEIADSGAVISAHYDRTRMVKYSVRHYAHYECFLKAKGAEGLRSLPAWKVGGFPYRLLKDYGFIELAKELTTEVR